MNREEKKKFVRDLLDSHQEDILAQIDSGNIPEEWDGIELRELIAEKADLDRCSVSRSRRRAYKNTVIVNNL